MEQKLASDPEYQLPEPQAFMTAKSYKTKFAEPLVKKLKKMVKGLIVQCAKAFVAVMTGYLYFWFIWA